MQFTFSTGTQAVVRSSDCSDTMKLMSMSRELGEDHPLTKNGARDLILKIADWAESLSVRDQLTHALKAQLRAMVEQLYRLGDVVADHSIKDFLLMRTLVGQCYITIMFMMRSHE